MGQLLCGLRHYLLPKKSVRLLMIGLDATGKTTILYQLKLGEIVTTIPTIGFNVETVNYKNLDFVTWDVGTRGKIRPLWRHYYPNTDGLIFVVDSKDRERLHEAKDELWRAIQCEELPSSAILLVMANKQDDPEAMSTDEISEKLELEKITSRSWHITGSSAIQCEGLYEGLEWLHNSLTGKVVKEYVSKPFKETSNVLLSNDNEH